MQDNGDGAGEEKRQATRCKANGSDVNRLEACNVELGFDGSSELLAQPGYRQVQLLAVLGHRAPCDVVSLVRQQGG